MENQPYFIRPYGEWSQEEHRRWIDAANVFGAHMFQYVRDNAVKQAVSETGMDSGQAKHAVDLALWTFMDFLDGYFRTMIDERYQAEYTLSIRVRDTQIPVDSDYPVVEAVELAPDGDGLVMGYSLWEEQKDFGQNR